MAMKYLDKYPKNLAKSLWIMKPVWTAFKLFCKTVVHRPVTVLYPYEKEWIPENYRGRPGLRFDRCVGCGMCARMCVTQAIKLIEVDDDNGNKVMRPQVNVGRCAFCGYCAEYCPVDAMTVTPEYELAEYTRYDLLYGPRRLNYPNTTPGMEVKLEVTLPSGEQLLPKHFPILRSLNAGPIEKILRSKPDYHVSHGKHDIADHPCSLPYRISFPFRSPLG